MTHSSRNHSDNSQAPVVYVVDDDAEFLAWAVSVLESVGLRTKRYETPSGFLAGFSADDSGCIVLDVRLPEMSGTQLYQQLLSMGVQTPVMMITAYGEVPDAVAAIKAGAVDYIQKPISEQSLLDRVQRALHLDQERRRISVEVSSIRDRHESLSPREVEVLDLLLQGKSTKQVSKALGVGLTTVDFHRHNLFEKMRVDNLVELTQLMDRYQHRQV